MALTAPPASDLALRYPEFAKVPTGLVDAILGDTLLHVDESWAEGDRKPAILSLAAHFLSVEGEPRRSADIAGGGTGDVNSVGSIKRDKVGDVETEFFQLESSTAAASSGGDGSAGYGSTSYGQRFLVLRRRNFPAILVV